MVYEERRESLPSVGSESGLGQQEARRCMGDMALDWNPAASTLTHVCILETIAKSSETGLTLSLIDKGIGSLIDTTTFRTFFRSS